jgi:endonuclease YncB( thermonuclease family)
MAGLTLRCGGDERRGPTLIRYVAAFVGVLIACSASADTLAGRASVIDGDTIEIHGQHIRILDIDAPESDQPCQDQDGAKWRCGQKAALALSDWIGQQPVLCETAGKDKYDRWLARCTSGGADLAEWLAGHGWGVPFRECKCEVVRAASDQARLSKVGIWVGPFILPWDWRARASKSQGAESAAARPLMQQPSGDCKIKGNINAKGDRIYHVPGSKWYDKAKIDESKGERWFCSESEAVAAGWRAPRG